MKKLINIHTHQTSTNDEHTEIVSLFHNAPIPFEGLFSIGVHPWHAEKSPTQSLIEELYPKARFAFAIGECGLDRSSIVDWELQMKLFTQQIELSEKLKKPLIIHAVRSYSDIMYFHNVYNPKQAWIVHGFQGNVNNLKQLAAHNIYISYGAYILRSNPKIDESLKATPDELIFIETDETAVKLYDLYKYAADLRNQDFDVLAEQIYNNCTRLTK